MKTLYQSDINTIICGEKMRKNSRLLLLLLWALWKEDISTLSYQIVYQVFYLLSEGGVRSMIWLLRRDGYVNVVTTNESTVVSITAKGLVWIEESYAIGEKGVEMMIMLVLKDARSLNRKLRESNAVELRKGVWLLTQEQYNRVGVKRHKQDQWLSMSLDEKGAPHFFSHFLQQKEPLDRACKRLDDIGKDIRRVIEKQKEKKAWNKKHFIRFFTFLSLIDDRFQDKKLQSLYHKLHLSSSARRVLNNLGILARSIQA